MEEVCEVGPKDLPKNSLVEELFSAPNVSRYVPVYKNLVMSRPKPDALVQLFWTFLGVTIWPNFFYEPGI